ncbi:heterokaryon incompatibility protein Het-C-domain-containing protein [Bombardia bombarda]|uniref:Heterokaryon incompatibility protein Het-C-domain-containing protein n=1 Tax=Bombardia bombarda TaxID=252184 RepID=A0AA39TQ00_9PEZI|nr:heterokaryon incompatibility protein Het-C-domain-containing protein [Bombardia bombarda]
MASLRMGWGSMLLAVALLLVMMPGQAAAFGAGNIPSIAQVEGHNWRHGDIEDILKTLAFLNGKKWTSMMVSRTYFGNWLRDYSQAVDVGSLKGVNAATIRILVWVLSFMAHGYATEEFEVTEERLGVYRPEEHIDNPLGYADNEDARKYDPRLRPPVDPKELEIDPRTGMKNYIANETGTWATSAGYLRWSFARSIHYGRVYTNGARGTSGKDTDLCEALRCLGQALHCMEDFSAHSNYCELALIELGHRDVFTHCGRDTTINLRGKRVYPLVTGTFGAVDFLHSVLGEATDHFTQSEVDEMNVALKNAEQLTKGGGSSDRGFFGSSGSGGQDFISLVGQLPGIGDGFASQARDLSARSAAQEQENNSRGAGNVNVVPGMSENFDPVKVVGQIYPILEFRDKIVRAISNMISKIPGLESLLDHISETLTVFILGLLAPFVQPIITQVSKVLKDGSSGLINSSAQQQLEPWNNTRCDNPTHSMLSKDHFTNVLNSCAGRVASTILEYVVPRVIFAWENPGVPIDEVVNDVLRAFHHPAARDDNIQIQRDMFETVRKWTTETPLRNQLDRLLSSSSVKEGHNHILAAGASGSTNKSLGPGGGHASCHDGGHGKPAGSLWAQIQTRDLSAMAGRDGSAQSGYLSTENAAPQQQYSRPTSSGYVAPGGYAAPSPGGYVGHQVPPPSVVSPGSGGGGYPGQGGYGAGAAPGGYPGQGGYGGQAHHQGPPPPPPQQQQGGGGYWQGGPPPPAPQEYGGPGQYGGPPPQQQQYGGPPQQQYGGQPPQQGVGGVISSTKGGDRLCCYLDSLVVGGRMGN